VRGGESAQKEKTFREDGIIGDIRRENCECGINDCGIGVGGFSNPDVKECEEEGKGAA